MQKSKYDSISLNVVDFWIITNYLIFICNALALDKAYLNTFNFKFNFLWCMEMSFFSIFIQKEKLRD